MLLPKEVLPPQGSKYYTILIQDHYSKYLKGEILKNKESETVLEAIDRIFKEMGNPIIF